VFDPAGQDTIGGGCGQLWFVQNWMHQHPDLAKPSIGRGLPERHAPFSWGSTTVRTRDGDLFEADETPADIARLRAAWRNRHEHEIGGVAITAIKIVNGVVLADFFETNLGDA
jgi:hypothetical protein